MEISCSTCRNLHTFSAKIKVSDFQSSHKEKNYSKSEGGEAESRGRRRRGSREQEEQKGAEWIRRRRRKCSWKRSSLDQEELDEGQHRAGGAGGQTTFLIEYCQNPRRRCTTISIWWKLRKIVIFPPSLHLSMCKSEITFKKIFLACKWCKICQWYLNSMEISCSTCRNLRTPNVKFQIFRFHKKINLFQVWRRGSREQGEKEEGEQRAGGAKWVGMDQEETEEVQLEEEQPRSGGAGWGTA